jgi:hypothetical protein
MCKYKLIMKKTITLIVLLMLLYCAQAQLQDRNWIFGRPSIGSTNATLCFGNQPVASNPVISLGNGQPNGITTTNGNEQWAIVTNPWSGDIVFYTDGKRVYNQQHVQVSSFDLGANVSSTQPVAIAPVPRSELKSSYNQYYIFTNPTGSFMSSYDVGPVKYRLFDFQTQSFGPQLSLPGPYGNHDVTEGMKIIPNDTNPDVLWFIVSLVPANGVSNKYVVYKIDKQVLTYHGDFNVGPAKAMLGSGASPIVYITYSRDNTPVGITNVGFAVQYNPAVFVCQFDNLSGQLLASTVKTCNTGYTASLPSIYNLEFSSSGQFLYYSVYRTTTTQNALFQVDLNDAVLVPTLIKTFGQPYAGGLKRGPDSLIYHISDDGYNSGSIKLGRVLLPDQKFIPGVTPVSQFYQENFQTYAGTFGIGLCEFLVLPYTAPAPPIGIDERTATRGAGMLRVWPNPASTALLWEYTGAECEWMTLQISNLHGQIILSERFHTSRSAEINIQQIPEGIYLVSVGDDTARQVKKLVVRR